MGPKMVRKRYQTTIKRMIDFWIGFWELPGGLATIDWAATVLNWGESGAPLKLLAKAKSDMNKVHGGNLYLENER